MVAIPKTLIKNLLRVCADIVNFFWGKSANFGMNLYAFAIRLIEVNLSVSSICARHSGDQRANECGVNLNTVVALHPVVI